MKRIIWFTLILSSVLPGSVLAAEKSGGLAASYITPRGDYRAIVGDGFGISAIFDYPMAGVIDISGSLGWYNFAGVTLLEGTNIKTESSTMWEFSAGPQVDFGKLYIGAEAGYYTEFDEWGVVPNVGLRKDLLDLSVRYNLLGDGEFLAVRAGFFF